MMDHVPAMKMFQDSVIRALTKRWDVGERRKGGNICRVPLLNEIVMCFKVCDKVWVELEIYAI